MENSFLQPLGHVELDLPDAREKAASLSDEGTCYFHEKLVGSLGHQIPLSFSALLVRGITAVVGVTSENLHLPGEKILGLAKIFLGVGIPGGTEDLFHQIDALKCLENIKGSTRLILCGQLLSFRLPRKSNLRFSSVISTVLGSPTPTLSVRLMQVFFSGSKDASVIDQKLKFDADSGEHVLETLPESVDVGSYIFSFEIILDNPKHEKIFLPLEAELGCQFM